MDRFNSNEKIEPSYNSIAKEIIYSDDINSTRIGQIVKAQSDSYKNGQTVLLEELAESMKGVVFIDRRFIEEWIERVANVINL